MNYLRGLQGKYAVATGPVGRPGETGDKLPGATRDAPTVPVPYFHPVVHPRPPRGAGSEAEAAVKKPEGKP